MPAVFVPIVVAGLTAIGVSAAVAAVVAPIVVGLVFIAGGLLISRLLSQQPSVPKPEDGHTSIQQTVPPRIFAYGRVRVAGAVMLLEESGGTMFQVSALVAHKISGIVQLYLNDDKVSLDGSNFVDEVEGIDDGRYVGGFVKIVTRLGLTPETPYTEITATLSADDIWTVDHRGDGQASLAMILLSAGNQEFNARYPFGRCLPSAVVDAALVYDWRDPSQIKSSPSTWLFSKNPIICLAHFECFSEFGPQRDFDTAILPVIDMWTDAANQCNEPINQMPRYELGGWASADLDPKAVRLAILNSCDGWTCERGDGALLVRVGKFVEPDVILTDDDIAGFYIQNEIPNEEAINFLAITYTSPEHGYSTVEADPYEDVTDQIDRGRRFDSTLELPWVQRLSQARRLGKREFFRARQTLRGNLDLRLSGINAVYERWIRIQSATIPGMEDVIIENRKSVINLLAGGYTIDFAATNAQIDDWSETEEGAPPTVPGIPTSDELPIPGNVVVTVEQTTGGPYLDITIDDPDRTDLGLAVRYRITDIGGAVPGAWVEQHFGTVTYAAGRGTVSILAVSANEEYDIEAAFIGTGGTLSAWSSTETADTGQPAPGSPTSLAAVGAAGHATITWNNPNSTNFAAARVWRNTLGGPFSGATDISGALFSAPNQAMTYVNTTAAGAYYYWVTAENSGGIRSSPTGPNSATVT